MHVKGNALDHNFLEILNIWVFKLVTNYTNVDTQF